jgi:hypothetical protein
MPRSDAQVASNRILLVLPPRTLARMWPRLQRIDTAKGQVIDRVGAPIEYMVNRGLISFVKTIQDGRTVEIGAVGIEGVTDPHALFGVKKAALETIVQIPATAYRIRYDALGGETEKALVTTC